MIYTIFTGGTIGSRLNTDGTVSTDSAQGFKLIDMYLKSVDTKEPFTTLEPYNILSENLEAKYIVKLVNQIQELLKNNDVEGIVITHGTDTLQYTSAILSYVFSYISTPILLVSSNYILNDVRANGLTNFYFSVRFIKEKRGSGVFVSYRNDGDYPTFHRGNRLQNSLSYSDNVYSVQNQYYGRYYCDRPNCDDWNSYVYEPSDHYCVDDDNSNIILDENHFHLNDDSGVIMHLTPYVGIKYPHITANIQAVLLDSFHSGTIGITPDLERFLLETKKNNIPVFLTGLSSDATKYETISEYEKYHIIPLYNRAPIAQYCKLWLLVSNGLPLEEYMNGTFAEEC